MTPSIAPSNSLDLSTSAFNSFKGKGHFNYVVTAQKPTSVSHSITACFLSSTEKNLIIAKSCFLEIYSMTPDGLLLEIELKLNGQILSIQSFQGRSFGNKGNNNQLDYLFLCTEKYQYSILAYNENTSTVDTLVDGTVKEAIGRPSENGVISAIHPQGKMIGLHLYEGNFKIVPLSRDPLSSSSSSATNRVSDFARPFQVRLEHVNVLDIKFWMVS